MAVLMKPLNKKYAAVLYCVAAAFCFSAMTSCVRCAGDLPFVQKSFFRNVIALMCAVVVLLRQKKHFIWNKGNGIPLLLRASFGLLGVLCNFYAVDHLLLANASMLNKMSPFFAIVLSCLFLNERPTLAQIVGVLAAFGGSLLIIKPSPGNLSLVPSLIGLAGGFGAGAAYTAVRELSHRGEDGSRIVFFFTAFSTLVLIVPFIAVYKPMTMQQLLILIGAGVFAAGGQYAITAAYMHAPAAEISVYDYSQIVFAAILGFFLFDQIPDIWSVAGYVCICGTAIIMFRHTHHHNLHIKK